MLLSDVAELYDLLVEYKGCTADYMVSLTKKAIGQLQKVVTDECGNYIMRLKKSPQPMLKMV